MRISRITAAVAAAAIVSSAGAGVAYDEAIDGDLSGDRFNPTAVTTTLGSNLVRMQVVESDAPGGDRDYFTVSIGAGEFIDQIILDESSVDVGFDSTAFVGLAFDDIFDFDPDGLTGPGLEGFVLTGSSLVGTDILGDLSGAGLSSLGPGDYSFWVQQTGEDLTTVGLDIIVAPAPSAASLLVLGAMGVARRRR